MAKEASHFLEVGLKWKALDNFCFGLVAGALHSPKGMRLKAYVPSGHVKVVFS